jgi:activator of HSP90 ATPase
MTNPDIPVPTLRQTLVRRHFIAGSALLVGNLFTAAACAGDQAEAAGVASSSQKANRMRTSLHQEIDFKASPQRIYETLLDSSQFSAFSGEPAQIERQAGGAVSMFGGKITGRIVELVLNQRIVQAWRPGDWDPGLYSMVRFELKPRTTGSHVVLDHTGFPVGAFEHLNAGWKMHYWDPLAKFVA